MSKPKPPEIEIKQSELSKAIATITMFTKSGSAFDDNPSYKYAVLSLDTDGIFSVSAWDGAKGCDWVAPIISASESFPTATVSAADLKNFVSRLPDAVLTLRHLGNSLEVKCGRSRQVFPSLPEEPNRQSHLIPSDDPARDADATLSAEDLISSSTYCFAYSKTEGDILQAVQMRWTAGSLLAIATDGHITTLFETYSTASSEFSFLLPGDSLQAIAYALKKRESAISIKVFATESAAQFDVYDSELEGASLVMSLHSRLIAGQYPDIAKIRDHCQSTLTATVRVNRQILAEAFDRVFLIAKDIRGGVVKVDFRPETVYLASLPSDKGDAEEEVGSVLVDGEPGLRCLNGKYIMDILKRLECSEVEVMLGQAGMSPVFVSPSEGVNVQYLLMPMEVPKEVAKAA